MNEISVEDNFLNVQAGALLSRVGNVALEAGLAGFEFASGIPGSMGGAVFMNAGAYGGEMKDILTEVTVLDENNEVRVLKKEELELGYRTSIVAKKGYVVLSAKVELKKGDQTKIRERMNELKVQRTTKQPLEYPSAGSTFKRPSCRICFNQDLVLDYKDGVFSMKFLNRTGAGRTVRRAEIGSLEEDRKSTRLNSSHRSLSRMPSSA